MQGPYLIVADVFLLVLFAYWFYEAAILRIPSKPLGGKLWPWYLPFAFACLFSIWVAARADWTLYEMVRVVKVGLILWYTRYNLKKREWWICAAAIGCAVTAQSILGVLEVAFHRTGVLWLLGQGSAESAAPAMFQEQNFYGFRRATATMNHPPNLACYLLLTIPLCAALAITHPDRRWRAGSAIATLIGLACLVCTQSRWPLALMALMLPALVIALGWARIIRLKQVFGILILSSLVVATCGAFAINSLEKRLTGDLKASVDLRERGNNAVLDMFADHNAIFGVGLNNYRAYALKYDPASAWVNKYEAFAMSLHLRFIAGPLNGFLLVLTESGMLGLGTFLIYLVGVAVIGIKAIYATSGYTRAAVIALVLGFAAVIAQQAVDYSYWVDPILYTATLVVGMLNCAKVAQERGPALVQK
jgi:hypothetical protein